MKRQSMISHHVTANLGVYFTSCEILAPKLSYGFSNKIKDYYWNYGFRHDGGALDEFERNLVVEYSAKSERTPAIWQDAESPIPSGWVTASREAWMAVDLKARLVPAPPSAQTVVMTSERPTASMRAVFDDAYSSGGSATDVGYFELQPEYGEAYLSGVPLAPARALHVQAMVGDTCVAIASISLVDDAAGLYSVATHHEWRNRGLGAFISGQALNFASNRGAQWAFLQTEADSAVEKMYRQSGFDKIFAGRLMTQVD